MDRFTNRTIIVTGAAGALGAAMVRRYIAEGATVVAGARHSDRLAGLVDELGRDRVIPAELDVTDQEQWAAAVTAAEDASGPVSVLVNNAARAVGGPVADLPVSNFREVLETNLVGSFLGIQAVVPSMRRGGGGNILNLNSVGGLGAAAGLVSYGASKWGMRGLTLTAAKELARDGIRVNGFHPGIIDTPLAYDPHGDLWSPVGDYAVPRLATVEEISAYVAFLTSDDARFSTGTELLADGGFMLGPIGEAATVPAAG